jgi:WD40 repeat protein
VATVKSTGLVQVWDFETGRELWRRIIPDQEVPRIASTPDGGLLAFAVGNGVEVLDAVRGTVRSARRAGFGRIGQVRFDGQGERLALVSEGAEGHRVEVVPAGDVSVSGVFFTHRQEIRSVEFSRDGRRLLTASSDNTARIWDIAAGRAECEPLRHSSGVYRAVFSPDEQRVATLCFGGAVWVWRLPERVEIPTLEFGQSVTAVGFARDGRHLAAGGVGGRVAWWQVGDGTPANLPTPHVGRVWQVEFSGNGRWLASAGSDGVVQLVDLETRSLRRLEHTDWTWVMSVRFDSEDKRMVTAGHDRHVLVWDVATGQALADLVHPQGVNEACFSPDGKFVLTRSKEDRARLWDSGTGRLLSESMQHASWLDAAFFGPEGGHVLTASRDMSVRRWSLVDAFRNAREPLMEVRAPAPVFGVVRDSAGRNLAGLLGDQTVALWQGGTLKPGPVLEHAQNVLTADFDPAGSRLATAAGKAGARIWDVASGHPLSEPLQPPGLTYVVRFDPSGERLLTAGDDGRLRFWPSRPMTRPAPSWLPDFAEAQAVLVGDSSSGFHQVGVKTWRQIQEMWKGREGFDATTRDGLSPTPP